MKRWEIPSDTLLHPGTLASVDGNRNDVLSRYYSQHFLKDTERNRLIQVCAA